MDLRLGDQSFLVSGGSSGIGLATAELLVREGARVTICARDPDRLRRAAEDLDSAQVRTVIADVTSGEDCVNAVKAALDHGDRLDGVAAVAGHGLHGTASSLSAAQVSDELTATVTGLLHLVQAASSHLQEVAGRVVALTAPTALEPDPAMAAIGTARAVLDNLVRSLALEYAPSGVRVNAVGVGLIDTPRQRSRFDTDASMGTSYEEWLAEQAWDRRVPMSRPGRADEVATAIVWLLSPVTSYTTGAVLDVTGGLRSRSNPRC